MISGITPITPFTSPEESTGDTVSIWTLFSHMGVYVMAIGLLIPAGLGIFCCYFFSYTTVDDDVGAAPIYRCDGRAKQPTRSHENHALCID